MAKYVSLQRLSEFKDKVVNLINGKQDTITTSNKLSHSLLKDVPTLDSQLSNLPSWTATPNDTTKLIRRDTGGGASFGQVTFSTIWEYIKSKISSVLGLTSTNYGGTSAKATSDASGNNIANTYATKQELASVSGGAVSYNTTFLADGSIRETYADGKSNTTVFNSDGSITTTSKDASGTTKKVETIRFNADGSIATTFTEGSDA